MNTLLNKVLGESENCLLFTKKPKVLFGQPNIYKIINKDVLYSTVNYPQYFVIREKNLKKNFFICMKKYICIYITESLCCTPETNTTL